jgi:hypothetical protein
LRINKKGNRSQEQKKESKKNANMENGETHESRASNISKPEVSTAVSSPDASFELEVHEARRSSGRFLFFKALSSEMAGGGNIVELLPS